jgi:hypothetical protein
MHVWRKNTGRWTAGVCRIYESWITIFLPGSNRSFLTRSETTQTALSPPHRRSPHTFSFLTDCMSHAYSVAFSWRPKKAYLHLWQVLKQPQNLMPYLNVGYKVPSVTHLYYKSFSTKLKRTTCVKVMSVRMMPIVGVYADGQISLWVTFSFTSKYA